MSSFFLGCGVQTASRSASEPAAAPPTPAKSDSAPVVQAAPPPVAHADSTGADPRPQVLVEGLAFTGVRTRLIPHVMGRGWALSVNKGDSVEFIRPADAVLSQALFGLVPASGTRIMLRFRLKAVAGGTQVATVSHLVGKSGVLPYKAFAPVLTANLEDLRQDLLAAPVSTDPKIDRIRK